MSNIFISHSSADRASVGKEFSGLIKALGYKVWIDTKSIRLSEEWKPKLATGLANADWFLLIVSRDAARSDWVKRETAWAIDNLSNPVIAIVIDGSNPAEIDPRLSNYQYLNFGKEPSHARGELVRLLVDAKYGGYDRDLSGRWISAVQPVYYPSCRWHVQRVEAASTSEGYLLKTVQEEEKLQWRFDATFLNNYFLVGPWRSTRASSRSQGFIALQVSRNGTYMCGHDYAMAFEESKANFGILLLGRSDRELDKAFSAMKNARREMEPLPLLREVGISNSED